MRVATFFPLTSRGVEEVARALPEGCRTYAPSWKPRNAEALSREVVIHRLPLNPRRWRGGPPLWARERFCNKCQGALVAYSVDDAGRIVRGWFTSPSDQAEYAKGGYGLRGEITCPIEAVWLDNLQLGQPSLPAHLFIGAERGWDGYPEAASRMLSLYPGRSAERLL